MHFWGNDFKYWNDIENAANEIGHLLKKWGRINVTTTKEKFGTARVYCNFGFYNVHSILYPGYYYTCYKWKFLSNLDYSLGCFIVSHLNKLIVPLRQLWYTWSYKRICKKYPHIWAEIINGTDYPEFLKEVVQR